MTATAGGDDAKNLVNSVRRAGQLLEAFDQGHPALGLTELADATGLNKTTTHRLLATLVRMGWLTKTVEGEYKIGMKLFSLGSIALAGFSLRDEARPLLLELAEQFGDTAYLMIPGDGGAVVIDLFEGSGPLTVKHISVGTVLPYHAAAGPMTILAYLPEVRERWLSGPLERFTDQTVVNPGVLAGQLDKIRAEGYTISDEDYLVGVGAVAAPVFGRGGVLQATISLGGPVVNFRGSHLLGVITGVREAAATLSSRLGHAVDLGEVS
ncbi:DNA-binding IclR family transcriptional regulator [Amycolatopsis bartoniae]|uniref:Glycerol operon regulatory protein n=1 Tax=Amycolatopsis bartoniae TaxID=941986 RepID=A0A8H9MEC1_9PSEU|nr:IclR family transcriptional regulator [Amycolatopsis bartoniae]MBB2938409.1 DNA-binding IclR family transcriptional regulator [Amycolatopsis bartoniae]TVT06097.1 IclR family transcriptional regulator [Amycolatopsis bartoniae]GHF71234.1 IclR family transcriptional regulator [Amycolatopsis bartoniae]